MGVAKGRGFEAAPPWALARGGVEPRPDLVISKPNAAQNLRCLPETCLIFPKPNSANHPALKEDDHHRCPSAPQLGAAPVSRPCDHPVCGGSRSSPAVPLRPEIRKCPLCRSAGAEQLLDFFLRLLNPVGSLRMALKRFREGARLLFLLGFDFLEEGGKSLRDHSRSYTCTARRGSRPPPRSHG